MAGYFFTLRIMQWFWSASDKRRERFVSICLGSNVQLPTSESSMNKKIVRKEPMAHIRIFIKDRGHLLGLTQA